MAAFLFEAATLDRGNVAVGSEANMTADLTGSWFDVSGIRQGEYGVCIPAKKIDGTTNTAGTLTVTLRFNNDKSGTYLKTIQTEAIAVDNTNGVVRTIHFMTDGYQWMQAFLDVSAGGDLGHVVAGPIIGGNSINRAH